MVDAGRRMLDVLDGKRRERGGLQGWGGCLMQAGGRLRFGLGGGGSRTCRAQRWKYADSGSRGQEAQTCRVMRP